MTKREAYEYLKDYLDNVFHNSNDYETYCYLRDCADTLAPPDPDPKTGLVPCGCGGKVDVAFYPGWHGAPDMYQVDCFNCHVGTRSCQTAAQAKAAWNTGMGYKGGAE